MPMFPDSGVPASDAKNSIDVDTPVGCKELWYSTSRCQPRFDPAAANAMLAEDMNLIMRGEVQYDCKNLDNIERAVRYINQRGLPRGVALTSGPFDYFGVLDPPATRHNDFMTLTIVPLMSNQGPVTLDIGVGQAPLLRNDGAQLKSKDLLAGMPALIAFYSGAWHLCGLASSQVPLVATGAVDGWIRTDGNDLTGDGTENTASKAFRTIQGAWEAMGGRYAASPLFTINLRLGIPGTYEGARIGPYGGSMSLTGDVNARSAYRIVPTGAAGTAFPLALTGVNCSLSGINLVMNQPAAMPYWSGCLYVGGGSVWLNKNQYTLEATSAGTCGIFVLIGACDVACIQDHQVVGNGTSCTWGKYIQQARFSGSPGGIPPSVWTWSNVNFNSAGHFLLDASVCQLGNMTINPSGTTGPRYNVQTNSVLYTNGLNLPGSTAGSFGTQGQVL